MYKFISKFFGKRPAEPFKIALNTIPLFLSEQEETAREKLAAGASVPVQNIRNGVAQLQHVVNGIAGAEQDPAIHPKLKSIAKNSLPQFVRAMNASLSKELPDAIEEFYAAAVDCVKGCLNSSRGQGRYLQVVFPEEMKDVRTGIDAIGREINILTRLINEYHQVMSRVECVAGLYDEVTRLKAELKKSEERDHRISSRLEEMRDRIEEIGKEIEGVNRDDRMCQVKDLESKLTGLEKKRDNLNRQYASASMTAAHVFRKAEKIASKQHHSGEITALRRVMEILSDHAIPEHSELENSLSDALPVALRMVGSGEIALKNKEEMAVFSDIILFQKQITDLCGELDQLDKEFRKTEISIESNTLMLKLKSLNREKMQLEKMRIKEQDLKEELSQWRQKCRENIPDFAEKLRNKMEDIVGEAVQIVE